MLIAFSMSSSLKHWTSQLLLSTISLPIVLIEARLLSLMPASNRSPSNFPSLGVLLKLKFLWSVCLWMELPVLFLIQIFGVLFFRTNPVSMPFSKLESSPQLLSLPVSFRQLSSRSWETSWAAVVIGAPPFKPTGSSTLLLWAMKTKSSSEISLNWLKSSLSKLEVASSLKASVFDVHSPAFVLAFCSSPFNFAIDSFFADFVLSAKAHFICSSSVSSQIRLNLSGVWRKGVFPTSPTSMTSFSQIVGWLVTWLTGLEKQLPILDFVSLLKMSAKVLHLASSSFISLFTFDSFSADLALSAKAHSICSSSVPSKTDLFLSGIWCDGVCLTPSNLVISLWTVFSDSWVCSSVWSFSMTLSSLETPMTSTSSSE